MTVTQATAANEVFTTTPPILADLLLSLADPKSDFATENMVPLVYKPAMTAIIVATLNAISPSSPRPPCSRWTTRSSSSTPTMRR